jgi:hypothetical protein
MRNVVKEAIADVEIVKSVKYRVQHRKAICHDDLGTFDDIDDAEDALLQSRLIPGEEVLIVEIATTERIVRKHWLDNNRGGGALGVATKTLKSPGQRIEAKT